MKFTVPYNVIKAALLTAGDKDVRSFLNAINFETKKHKVLVTASSGHILYTQAVYLKPDVVVDTDNFTIPREVFDTLPKPKGKNGKFEITIEVQGTEVKIVPSWVNSIHTSKLIDVKFPEWKKLVPQTCSGEATYLNPDYLKIAEKIGVLLDSGFYLTFNGEKGASVITYKTVKALMLIMPMRDRLLTAAEYTPEAFINL